MNLSTPNADTVAELQATMDPNAATRNTGPAPEGFVKCTEIAKFLNKALADAGSDARMKPQMVYSYAKNGRGGIDNSHYPFVTEEDAQRFVNYHFARLTLGDEVEADEENEDEIETVEETVEVNS